jgi:lipoprotein-anchoring transpeptidase ErfK/SrfK
VIRTVATLVIAAGLACAAAPAAQQTRSIAWGVRVGSVRVGGLSSEPARQRITVAAGRPVTLSAGSNVIVIHPAALGARLDVNAAVSAALAATPGSRIAIPVRASSAKVAAVVARLAKRYYRASIPARVVDATSAGPQFAAPRAGRAVEQRTMRVALAQALSLGRRTPLQLVRQAVPAKRTVATFGPVIVIDRTAHTLKLYDGKRLVRTFPVAVGQPIYPTPAGIWSIKDKQLNPWWYPPTYDAWAKGLKPVPPGPGNPLGTRWMGLTAPGVGIHGTDADTSIGYSLSHGCIRMHVPDAEWLYPHVHVGTPVVIL